jgi:phytoene/squalene synthetase
MQDAFTHCETLLRAGDKDRFLAALFAPAEHRSALYALYAFNLEIARVREVAHGPLAGEIRLQWWCDVLGGEGRGEVEGHARKSGLPDLRRSISADLGQARGPMPSTSVLPQQRKTWMPGTSPNKSGHDESGLIMFEQKAR